MKFLFSRVFIKQLFLATIIFSIIVLGSIVFLFFYTNQTSRVIVPNLNGMNLDEIELVISKNKLRYEIIDSSFYNQDFDKNTVLEQIPVANKEVKKNRKIYLTTNPSSYGDVILPDLIQLTKRNAVSTLVALDLKIGDFIYEDNIGKDMVLDIKLEGESIESGSLIPKKSTVDLILGNGKK
jgi:beta-lactam-binding protein with PASTA domain|tara:strand:+ start:433 stop:975 length:543 start_codon:yes stop_codon:yes gene_type:complete